MKRNRYLLFIKSDEMIQNSFWRPFWNMIQKTMSILAISSYGFGAYSQGTQDIIIDSRINTSYQPVALDENVNSGYRELKPLISLDGKKLYFSRHNHPENVGGLNDPEDIWLSIFDENNNVWNKAINVGPPLNNEWANFVSEVVGNGDTLVLGNIYKKKAMKRGISVSWMEDGEWIYPEEIHIQKDYSFSGSVSYDFKRGGDILVISEEREDTFGENDLYIVFRVYDGKYKFQYDRPLNLGKVINSQGDEVTPKIAEDGNGIYFSSDGHKGFGGYDLFYSERLDDTWTNWGPPKNLGPGLNTEYDDQAPSLTSDGKWAYFSRGISETDQDIYLIDVLKLLKND